VLIGDDRIGVEALTRGGLDLVGAHHHPGQRRERHCEHAQRADELADADHRPQHEHRHDRGGDEVDHPGYRRTADHPEHGEDDERPRQSAEQCTQVVGCVEIRQYAPGVGGTRGASTLQQRHQ
jgi:hypothetical protein